MRGSAAQARDANEWEAPVHHVKVCYACCRLSSLASSHYRCLGLFSFPSLLQGAPFLSSRFSFHGLLCLLVRCPCFGLHILVFSCARSPFLGHFLRRFLINKV